MVTVDASVQRDRRPVTGLKAADFELLDNGVPQEITDVAYERLPIDVTVLLDVSASVTGPVLDELGRALRQVRADLLPGDRLRLLTFNMSVRRLVDFSQPLADIDRRWRRCAAPEAAPCSTAWRWRCPSFDAPGRRRLVVLFSDGQDSSSISDADTLLDVARRTTPTVAIILGSPNPERPASLLRRSSAAAGATVGALSERIARETGGIVAPLKRGENPDLEIPPHAAGLPVELRALLHTAWRGARRCAHARGPGEAAGVADVRARRGYVWR